LRESGIYAAQKRTFVQSDNLIVHHEAEVMTSLQEIAYKYLGTEGGVDEGGIE
jgi:hypothetical protein